MPLFLLNPVRLGLAFALLCASTATVHGASNLMPAGETQSTLGNAPVSAVGVFWQGGRALLVNDEEHGIDAHNFEGKRLATFGRAGMTDLDARSGLEWHGRETVVVATIDEPAGRPAIFTAQSGEFVESRLTGFDQLTYMPDALCLFYDHVEANLYLFLLDGDGMAEQWLLMPRGDSSVEARAVRSLPVGGETKGCQVDDRVAQLYVAEEGMAIWQWDAHPERPVSRRPLDLVAPWGSLDSPTDIAIDPDREQIVVADEGSGSLHFYARDTGLPLGAFQVVSQAGIDGVEAPEMITWVPAVSDSPLEDTFAQGGLVVTDEDNANGAGNYKLIDATSVAAHTRRVHLAAAPVPEAVVVVKPIGATDPVATGGDAADDPAIWVHPEDPSKSLVLGTDKKAGLAVYGLDGKLRQFFEDGRVNNVDLRDGFSIQGREVVLVAASNRTTKGISFYSIDPDTGEVSRLSAETPVDTGFDDPYGLCNYRSRNDGHHYVFVNDKEGNVGQWRIEAKEGRIVGQQVREWSVGSITEGCVADDDHGHLYIGEENVALWRYGAEPGDGESRHAVDYTRKHGGKHLTADIEGVAMATGASGGGYLVVSSQGDDSFAVYRREGDHDFVGRFRIGMNAERGLDGASETDGVDVTSANLGPGFSGGLLVVQDGRNLMPESNQNFKFVSWEAVLDALGE